MSRIFRESIQKLANRAGYKIEKIRLPVEQPIDVLELLIERLTRIRGADFTFVQVGACDGLQNDPIRRHVQTHRWRGVLVEPQPSMFALLKMNYQDQPQLAFENAVVARENGSATLYRLKEGPESPDWTTGLATLDRNVLVSHRDMIPGIESLVEEIQVLAITFDALLDRHGLKRIDLLQIDTEGFDFEVIKLVDFERARPALIHYEHFHLVPDDQLACRQYLVDRGYRLATVLGDTVAAHEEVLRSDK